MIQRIFYHKSKINKSIIISGGNSRNRTMDEIHQIVNPIKHSSTSSAVAKKILSDLIKLNDPIYKEHFTADVVDGDPYRVRCTIVGIDGTLYEKLSITAYFIFPLDYPFKPPTILFSPPLFHPNIGTDGMLDPQLFSDWCPAYTIPLMLVQILSLLDEPHYCLQETNNIQTDNNQINNNNNNQINNNDKTIISDLSRICINSFAQEVWDDKITMRGLIIESISMGSRDYLVNADSMVEELSVDEIQLLFAAMEKDK